MKVIDTSNWGEFTEAARSIQDKYGKHSHPLSDGRIYTQSNTVLFRGQRNAHWPITTTLERVSQPGTTLLAYCEAATRFSTQLESYTGVTWDLPDFESLRREVAAMQMTFRTLPAYAYMVYLRHHGFPSPLLDWSESPFVAAYFALCDNAEQDEPAAIYCYINSETGGHGHQVGEPVISLQGPYVRTHQRHFTQQAWYTVCTCWEENQHVFRSHIDVFDRKPDPVESGQDVLYKITLPLSERSAALERLVELNITHYTLFQTEDALVRTMAIKAFELPPRSGMSRAPNEGDAPKAE